MDAASRLARFARLLARPDDELELDAIGLVLGDWEAAADERADDGVIAAGRARLDALAAAAARRAATAAAPWAGARAVAHTLFVEAGFHGDHVDYLDPRASFLGEVLVRRTGLPIALAVLFLEVARRIGVAARGIGLPGHFIVRVDADPVDGPAGEVLLLDPFHRGRVLTEDDARAQARRAGGPDAEHDPGLLSPAPPRAIVARMLRNLAGVYGRAGDLERSVEVLERQALVEPHNPAFADRAGRAAGAARRLN
ncbi:MAG: transglutaminase-like domain-containing protein [Kofleriaceae bacterium]